MKVTEVLPYVSAAVTIASFFVEIRKHQKVVIGVRKGLILLTCFLAVLFTSTKYGIPFNLKEHTDQVSGSGQINIYGDVNAPIVSGNQNVVTNELESDDKQDDAVDSKEDFPASQTPVENPEDTKLQQEQPPQPAPQPEPELEPEPDPWPEPEMQPQAASATIMLQCENYPEDRFFLIFAVQGEDRLYLGQGMPVRTPELLGDWTIEVWDVFQNQIIAAYDLYIGSDADNILNESFRAEETLGIRFICRNDPSVYDFQMKQTSPDGTVTVTQYSTNETYPISIPAGVHEFEFYALDGRRGISSWDVRVAPVNTGLSEMTFYLNDL